MAQLPPFARAWLRQRDTGATAIAAIEARELRELEPVAALRIADALLDAAARTPVDDARRVTSGLVEQQRLFARARR